jgi:glucokinase-like ROK family protein
MARRFRTGDQLWVRERNLAILLHYLWEASRPVSRAYLTTVSGLNKVTVGTLTAQLQSWAFVRESGMSEPRPGRPGVLLDLDPDGGRVIGVELGVGFISVRVLDFQANTIWARQIVTGDVEDIGQDQQQVLAQAESVIAEAVAKARAGDHRLFGIGVGVPGLVDRTTGILLFAPNLRWRDVPLQAILAKRFGVPVVVENEANAAALGESMLGVATAADDFVYLSAGVGLGGGLVIDGKLYGGSAGFAGEIGHMTIEPDGPLCGCGNRGCWEVLVGPKAVVQQARRAAAEGRAPELLALSDVAGQVEAIRMSHVLAAAAGGSAAVLEILDEMGRYLGIGIANLVNAFNPGMVVLGGMLSLAGTYILPRAQQEVDARALAAPSQGARIVLSDFTFDACVVGSAALILREILNNPTAWQPRLPPFPEAAEGNQRTDSAL